MAPERILLIRHGETDWNATGRWQGFAPTDLNATGRAQAEALAGYLADWSIDSLYSSDLPRSLQTALPLARTLRLEPQLDPRWREINLGIFQGLTYAEIEARYPQELSLRNADIWEYAHQEGESRRDLQRRAYAAWLDVSTRTNGRQAAVVSHGGTIRTLLWKLFGEDDSRLDVHIPNTSITALERAGDSWALREIAVTPHLDRL
jgi:broad specificity phosphatase PhoE